MWLRSGPISPYKGVGHAGAESSESRLMSRHVGARDPPISRELGTSYLPSWQEVPSGTLIAKLHSFAASDDLLYRHIIGAFTVPM